MAPHERAPMTTRPDGTFLTRVRLRNYKSIAECDVRLGPLTFLVGPNGSGKSNFLDALRFVSDSLRARLDQAVGERGGVRELFHRTSAPQDAFGWDFEFLMPDGASGRYEVEVVERGDGPAVRSEQCSLRGPDGRTKSGMQARSPGPGDPRMDGRLGLVVMAEDTSLFPVYQALSSMSFYNPSPRAMRELQPPEAGEHLLWDASNAANVLARLQQHEPARVERINEYLRLIVPGLDSVAPLTLGPRRTVQFIQAASRSGAATTFYAANMSDGTLRALGILIALFQRGRKRSPALLGIEEPEAALHPGAVGILLGALEEASRESQVVVTSHSPDLLDDKHITADQILAVSAESGSTRIAPIDAVGRDVLRRRLYTAGELLRLGELRPEPLDGSKSDPAAPGMVADRDG